jgi:hypothetical protein
MNNGAVPGLNERMAISRKDEPVDDQVWELQQLLTTCEHLLSTLGKRHQPLDQPLRLELEEVHRRIAEKLDRLRNRLD